MNKTRRAEIAALVGELQSIHDAACEPSPDYPTLSACIEAAHSQLVDLEGDEQEAYDNMPESFQLADKGLASLAAVQALQAAQNELILAGETCTDVELTDRAGTLATHLDAAITPLEGIE